MELRRRRFLQMAAVAVALPAPLRGANAQSYPSRPVTALAERGRVPIPIDLGDRSPEEFAAATRLIGLFSHVEREGKPMDIAFAVRGLSADDRAETIERIVWIKQWIDQVREMVGGAR